MLSPYRRMSQIGVFALMFVIPVLNSYEIYAITGTYYAINIGGLGITDPVAILQTIVASGELAPPILGSLIFPALLALILGRVWCGWMCPYHLMTDVTAWLRAWFRKRILGKSEWEAPVVPRPFKANMIRYGFLLAGTLAAGAIGIPILNYVSAPGILSTEAMILVRQGTLSLEFGFIAMILLLELFLFPRFWCRLFCPTGACLSLFRTPFTMTVRSAVGGGKTACCKNERCTEACPMGLAPYGEGTDLLCTNCGECIDACSAKDGPGTLGFTGFG